MPRGPKTVGFVADTTVGDGVAYASGDQVGGASSSSLQFPGVGGFDNSGEIKQLVVTLETVTAAELDLVLYNDTFTAGTNNAAFTENAPDIAKSVGVINIPAASFKAFGGNVKRATISTSLLYTLVGTILYGNLVVRGALTLTANTVHVGIGVERA